MAVWHFPTRQEPICCTFSLCHGLHCTRPRRLVRSNGKLAMARRPLGSPRPHSIALAPSRFPRGNGKRDSQYPPPAEPFWSASRSHTRMHVPSKKHSACNAMRREAPSRVYSHTLACVSISQCTLPFRSLPMAAFLASSTLRRLYESLLLCFIHCL
jgi:hypothetical protein